jgi:hypothetical protein
MEKHTESLFGTPSNRQSEPPRYNVSNENQYLINAPSCRYEVFGVKRERDVILLGRFELNTIPMKKEDTPHLKNQSILIN